MQLRQKNIILFEHDNNYFVLNTLNAVLFPCKKSGRIKGGEVF